MVDYSFDRLDPIGAFDRGDQLGARLGAQARNARAYQSGGIQGVEDAAGRTGDLETMNYTQGMQQRQRQSQDETTQRAYQRMQTIAPWALNVIKGASTLAATDPDRARAFLTQNQQRFADFGFSPEQIQAGIAGLTNADPNVRQQYTQELTQAFTQHQDPNWSIRGTQVVGVDPQSGAVTQGGTVPEELQWQHDAATPYAIDSQGVTHTGSGTIPDRRGIDGSGDGHSAPSGYRWKADGSLEAIPGGPANGRAQMASVRARSAFFAEPVPHAYQAMRTMWPRVEAFLSRTNNGTSANVGDPALQADLLDAYVQMMNGGRQITEQQVHNISNYQGTVAQAQQALNRLTSGDNGGVLTPQTVRSLIATARAYRQQLSGQYPAEVERFSRRATAMGMQPTEVLDPAELIPDPENMSAAPAPQSSGPQEGQIYEDAHRNRARYHAGQYVPVQ